VVGKVHRDAACVDCHREFRWLLSKVYVEYALGIYTTQLRAEVPGARCLSCPKGQELDTDQPFKKAIHFSHRNHMGHMKRGKHLHCTSCHFTGQLDAAPADSAMVVQADHPTCYICHFKGAEKGQAATGCLVCHEAPKTVVTHQDFQFDHQQFLPRVVRCDLCHAEVIRGDADVPPARCAACQVSRAEAIGDPERIHRVHLAQHAIDGFRCHNAMEHGRVQLTAALEQNCTGCHIPSHTHQEQMCIGIGGRGVPSTPDTMFLSRVACNSCHIPVEGDAVVKARALRGACAHRHGAGCCRMCHSTSHLSPTLDFEGVDYPHPPT
jgi:hypothetical protein